MDNKVGREISVKQLILILLKGWKFIIISIVVGLLVSFVYSNYIATPIYKTETEMFMNVKENVKTEYGSYNYPSINGEDYFELIRSESVIKNTIEDQELEMSWETFSKKISVSQEKESTMLKVIYKGSNPKEIATILDAHILNFINYLNYSLKEDATNKFLVQKNLEYELNVRALDSLNQKLKRAESDLSQLSPTIIMKKALTSDPVVAAKYADINHIEVADVSDQMIVEEIVNSNYYELERIISNYKNEIISLEIAIAQNSSQISELEHVTKQYNDGNFMYEDSEEWLKSMNIPAQQISPASTPNGKVSPDGFVNAVIGIVLMSFISMFILLFRAYWDNN